MNINIWNLSQTKTSFFIRQRTEAQRKHLNTIKKIKSKIDLKNNGHSSEVYCHVNKSRLIDNKKDERKSAQRNSISCQQNSSIDDFNHTRINTSYVQNLRISSSLSRIRHNREIQKQNCKLIQRLIKAKPSISQIQFKKNHLNHLKYKQNILRHKYINPDYTTAAQSSKKSFNHLLLKPIMNLTNLGDKGKQNKIGSRIKTDQCQSTKNQKQRFFVAPFKNISNQVHQ